MGCCMGADWAYEGEGRKSRNRAVAARMRGANTRDARLFPLIYHQTRTTHTSTNHTKPQRSQLPEMARMKAGTHERRELMAPPPNTTRPYRHTHATHKNDASLRHAEHIRA